MKAVLIVATYIGGFALKSNEVGDGLFVNPPPLSEAHKYLANSRTAAETVASIMQGKGPEVVDAVASWVQNQTQIPMSLKQVGSELATVMKTTSNDLDAVYLGLELRAEADVSKLNPGFDDMMFFVIREGKAKFCWGLAGGIEPHIHLGNPKESGYEVEGMVIAGGAHYDSFRSGGKGLDFFNNSIVFFEVGAEMRKEELVRGDVTVGFAVNNKTTNLFMVGVELGPDKDLAKPVMEKLHEIKNKFTSMLQTQNPEMLGFIKNLKYSVEINGGGMWCTPEL